MTCSPPVCFARKSISRFLATNLKSGAIFLNFSRFVSLVHTQAVLSLKAEASKLYLSYLWWILEPLLFVLVFYVVFSVLLTNRTENFLLFLMCGKIPFLWLAKSVNSAASSIVANRGLIGQLDVPKVLFPYTAVQIALYKQWAVFLVLLGVVMGYGLMPELNWVYLLPLFLVQYLLILTLAIACALLVSFIPDTQMLVNMGITFLMFCSGIFWDVRSIGNLQLQEWLLIVNPLLFLIESYRDVLMYRSSYNMHHLVVLGMGLGLCILMLHGLSARLSRAIAARVTTA